MRNMLRTIAAGAMLLAAVPVHAAQWVRVETPNFVVFGEVGEKRTREVASEFERFREALARVLSGAATKAPVPTTVVVFDNSKSFGPYRPLYNGKAVEVAGMFSSERDINRVALALEDREQGLRTIFHEYVHLVVSNVTNGMPIWLNEGLAEYYSTFLVTDDGKTATMGTVIAPHLLLLNEERLLPLPDLLAITHDSPMYNEGQRRGMVYAESWVLVHFLLSDPNRSKQLGEYARVTGAGMPAAAAWQQVFGAYDPLPDLRRYAQQFSVRGYRYHFTQGIETIKGDAVRLTDAEVEATLGDELLGVGRREDAEVRLKKAAAMQPPSSRAKALLGLERVNDHSYDEARKLLMEAAGDRDWLTQYYVAAGLANMIQSDREDAVLATGDVARAAMEAVLAVRPELPHILALQGLVAMATQKNVDAAALAAKLARTLAPGREDYAFLEASLHMMRRDYRSAREILAPMMSGRYPEPVRDRARTLMGQAVTFEQRERDYAARRTEAPAAGSPAAPPPTAPEAVNDPPMRPIYRPIEPGEQRTEGLLERIACLAQGALLEVRVDGALLKFFVPRLDQVDFISYRPSLTGAVNCGTRTPADHVYVTWREPPAAAADVKGRAVAVEFLPK
jgi:tetratricopeptide (TPR) repeat protein